MIFLHTFQKSHAQFSEESEIVIFWKVKSVQQGFTGCGVIGNTDIRKKNAVLFCLVDALPDRERPPVFEKIIRPIVAE